MNPQPPSPLYSSTDSLSPLETMQNQSPDEDVLTHSWDDTSSSPYIPSSGLQSQYEMLFWPNMVTIPDLSINPLPLLQSTTAYSGYSAFEQPYMPSAHHDGLSLSARSFQRTGLDTASCNIIAVSPEPSPSSMHHSMVEQEKSMTINSFIDPCYIRATSTR